MRCFYCGREVKETTHRRKDYKVDYYLLHKGKTELAFFRSPKEDVPTLQYLKLTDPVDTLICVRCYDRPKVREQLDSDFAGRKPILGPST